MKIFKRVYQIEICEHETTRVVGYVNVRLKGDGYDAYKRADANYNFKSFYPGKIIRVK